MTTSDKCQGFATNPTKGLRGSRLSARSVLLLSAEVSTGHPHPLGSPGRDAVPAPVFVNNKNKPESSLVTAFGFVYDSVFKMIKNNKVSLKPFQRLAGSRGAAPCGRFGGVRVSGGDLCVAEAPTEPTGETQHPPTLNFTKKVFRASFQVMKWL